jgi:Kef-type K+ transport system membrane component KefB
MGLLLLSYIGSFLASGRAIRGVGLPSGVEYIVLGFVLGPDALGLLERSSLDLFEPVAEVTVGWLMFVLGLKFGVTGERRVRPSRLFGGALMALVTGGAVGAAAYGFLTYATRLSANERLVAATGAGAVCAETTRYAVRWVIERYGARGPLSELVSDLADSDDILPLLAVTFTFALRPAAPLALPIAIPFWGMAAFTIALGLLLGGVAAILMGKQFAIGEAWGVLLGSSMLLIGTTDRLGLSPIAAMFAMGLALSALSPHRAEVGLMVAPTERAVLLPSLLLAGANVHFGSTKWLPWFVATCVAARGVTKLLVGVGLFGVSPSARRAGPTLGVGLLSAGALSMCIGLTFTLRFPGPIGDAVLASAAVVTALGEFVGPSALRAALRRAGEIVDAPKGAGATATPPPIARAGGTS